MRGRDPQLALLLLAIAAGCKPSTPDSRSGTASSGATGTASAPDVEAPPGSSSGSTDPHVVTAPDAAVERTYLVDATVRSIQPLSRYRGKAWDVNILSSFVVELDVIAVAPEDGKQGAALQPSQTIAIAVHSPARSLMLDADRAAGERVRVEVTMTRDATGVRYGNLQYAFDADAGD